MMRFARHKAADPGAGFMARLLQQAVGPDALWKSIGQDHRAWLRVFLVLAAAILLLKLLAASEREVLPERDDNLGYVRYSVDEFRSVLTGDSHHPPGASIFIATARLLGIPYRIFIEIALAISAFMFFRCLMLSASFGFLAALLGYALILFHPVLVLEMDRAMADPVGFICWLLGAGGLIGFIAARREQRPCGSLGLAIVAFAFSGITRSGEGAIVLAEMAAVGIISLFLFRGRQSWRCRRAVLACVCAATANILATQTLSGAHYLSRGYWGATAVESREWWSLYRTLLSLPVRRDDRHALVNRATLAFAYDLSPTFRKMEACIALREHTWEPRPLSGGFKNSLVPWAILGCLPGSTSHERFAAARQMAAEIADAAQNQGLQEDRPLLGIIPRAALQWLPELANSVADLIHKSVSTPQSTNVNYSSWEALGGETESLLNRGVLRRGRLVHAGDNPELPGYEPYLRATYTLLNTVALPAAFALAALLAMLIALQPEVLTRHALLLFAVSLVISEVAARLAFYSVVNWIGWEIPLRYVIASRVLIILPCVLLAACAGALAADYMSRAALPRRAAEGGS